MKSATEQISVHDGRVFRNEILAHDDHPLAVLYHIGESACATSKAWSKVGPIGDHEPPIRLCVRVAAALLIGGTHHNVYVEALPKGIA